MESRYKEARSILLYKRLLNELAINLPAQDTRHTRQFENDNLIQMKSQTDTHKNSCVKWTDRLELLPQVCKKIVYFKMKLKWVMYI